MSLITPSRQKGPHKGGARRAENNKIYAHPLPLVFSAPESRGSRFGHVLGLFTPTTRLENPHCEGIFDPATRSIWITNEKDSMILWRRGFFGKGDLSRSEPSWLARQINARKAAGKCTHQIHFDSSVSLILSTDMTSEEIREKRRAERKQFKMDRAAAIARAAAEAEAAFAEGREAAPAFIPSGATWKPSESSEVSSLPPEPPEEQANEGVDGLESLENVEHLQLTLQEAFFLIWTLDCLTVLHHHTVLVVTFGANTHTLSDSFPIVR